MFRYKNSLRVCDEEKYPYSMEYIKESRYDHRQSICSENGFTVTAIGSKHLFSTPDLQHLSLKMNVNLGNVIKTAAFCIILGYDKVKRTGTELQFAYGTDNVLGVSLIDFSGSYKKQIEQVIFENVKIAEKNTVLTVISEDGYIKGSLGKCKFSFECTAPKGRAGIEVTAVYGGITFSDAVIVSKDMVERIKVYTHSFTLPNENGGMVSYSMSIDVFSYGDVFELKYKFDGGISSHEILNSYGDAWITLYDDITEPYIRLISAESCKKFSLYKGTVRFLAKNIGYDVRKIYENVLNVKDTPISGSFFINGFDKYSHVAIGYEYFDGWCYMTMSGSCEYIFDSDNTLVYSGEPLIGDAVVKFRSVEKKLVDNIPKCLYGYDKAKAHVENNHYFYTDEKPSFELYVYTAEGLFFTEPKISLTDAFFNKICDIVPYSQECVCDFEGLGYNLKKYSFKLDELNCGVYHLSADVIQGDVSVANKYIAFEVIDADSELSPQDASGLPVMYVGDGAPALSETCVPDFYAVKSDFDFGHYCSVGLYAPIAAQNQRIWELASLYKRKVFTWNTRRCTAGYDLSMLDEIITKSDFNNYFYPELDDCPVYYRFDLYNYNSYSSFLKNKLNEFLNLNKHYKDELGIDDATASFTYTDFLSMLRFCGGEWIEFALVCIRDSFEKQTAPLKEKNPLQKRCSYGPWPAYHSNYKGGYSIKWYGFDPEKLHETFDGFMQFEDYPFSSAYATYACAWSILTTKLVDSKVKIYPELYFSFPDACPDQAVTEAYPPFGGSDCPLYFSNTQICEYVYNTPFYAKGKFEYWKDYGFSIFSFIDKPRQRAKEILSLWGVIKENKPSKPKKTTVFLYDLNSTEDRYEYETARDHFYNISESNLAYVYGIMKSSGLTGGFAARFKDIFTLDEKDINCIVLPDMSKADDEIIARIRELHGKGVMLIAVSRVPGLEDLFGVKENFRSYNVSRVYDENESENITPVSSEFFYENISGNTILYADGDVPVIIENGNTVLLNTCVSKTGIDCLRHIAYHGRPNISAMMAKFMRKAIKSKIKTVAESDCDTGLALLVTEGGHTLLVITDYSKYDANNNTSAQRRNIRFNTDEYTDAVLLSGCCGDDVVGRMCENGILKGVSVSINPHETLIFRLIEK